MFGPRQSNTQLVQESSILCSPNITTALKVGLDRQLEDVSLSSREREKVMRSTNKA